jgi:hypothetical protein
VPTAPTKEAETPNLSDMNGLDPGPAFFLNRCASKLNYLFLGHDAGCSLTKSISEPAPISVQHENKT